MKRNEKPVAFDIASFDTPVLLGLFISILSEKAWEHMGLRVRPGTDKAEKDLERAMLAIDSIAFLIDRLDPYVKDDEKGRLRSLLADLQIDFAKIK